MRRGSPTQIVKTRSASPWAQSNQGLVYFSFYCTGAAYSIRRPWPDCADVQVNLAFVKRICNKNSGPSCSKLTMSLIKVSLKLRSLNMAYMLIFFAHAKATNIFFSKNTCELDIVLTRTVNILTTNELVKLTMLWTSQPFSLAASHRFMKWSNGFSLCWWPFGVLRPTKYC